MARIDFTQPQILWNEICLRRLLSFRGFSFVFTPGRIRAKQRTEQKKAAGFSRARESEPDVCERWMYVYILRPYYASFVLIGTAEQSEREMWK